MQYNNEILYVAATLISTLNFEPLTTMLKLNISLVLLQFNNQYTHSAEPLLQVLKCD